MPDDPAKQDPPGDASTGDAMAPHGPPPAEAITLEGLTKTTPAPSKDAPADKGSPVAVKPTSLDDTRERIAYILLGTLGAIILIETAVSVLLAQGCWQYGRCTLASSALGLVSTTTGTIFTAMVGLVGSVVGFYFGSQKQQST